MECVSVAYLKLVNLFSILIFCNFLVWTLQCKKKLEIKFLPMKIGKNNLFFQYWPNCPKGSPCLLSTISLVTSLKSWSLSDLGNLWITQSYVIKSPP